jgi:hypothetical protein
MRPNLSDAAERAVYRRELLRLKRGWRWAGVALCCVGVAALLYSQLEGPPRPMLRMAGWGAIATGFASFLYVIVTRTRYHKRRMAEGV